MIKPDMAYYMTRVLNAQRDNEEWELVERFADDFSDFFDKRLDREQVGGQVNGKVGSYRDRWVDKYYNHLLGKAPFGARRRRIARYLKRRA